jgi:hypothetical protein
MTGKVQTYTNIRMKDAFLHDNVVEAMHSKPVSISTIEKERHGINIYSHTVKTNLRWATQKPHLQMSK